MTADVSPSWQWQFPAEEPVSSWRGPRVVSRPAPASADGSQASVSTFRVDHLPAEAGLGAWQAQLTLASDDQAPELDAPSAAGEPDEELAAQWNEAARVWTKCYQASAEPTRAALCLVLGARVDFDGLVAHQLLEHHLLLCADELAQRALTAAAKKGDAMAEDPAALGRLGAELRAMAPELRRALLAEAKPLSPGAEPEGLPTWDARLAAWLDQLGAKPLAKEVRQRGLESAATGGPALWERWLPSATQPPLRRLTFAALGLWQRRVRLRLEAERRTPPALVVQVHEDVTRVHSRLFRSEEQGGERRLVFSDDVVKVERVEPLQIPAYEMAVVGALVARGLDRLGSLAAHRLLRWEVLEGHRRVLAGDPDARALRIAGGWDGLAEQLGMSEKASDDLHAIVVAQAHCAFRLPTGGYGNLLSYTVEPARGRRRGRVSIILGDALLPHYCFEITQKRGKGRATFEAMRLVPMLDLPPFVGRPNEHGAQATLSMAVAADLRRQARDLAKHGGVLLNFDELARQSGVTGELLPRLLDRWTRDGDDGPAFLLRVEPGRFTLANAHKTQREFIEAQGQKEMARSKAGQRSVARRQRKLTGKAGGGSG